MIIAPSLLSADFSKLSNEISDVEKAGADWLHLDVMDGHFVPNLTFGPPVIEKIRPCTKLFFDTHLMIANPDRYLGDFARAGADLITFHIEAVQEPLATIAAIKALGKQAGVSLRPATAVEALWPLLDHVDLVLVMSVEPGFGGQSFMPVALPKLHALREKIDRSGRDIRLEVDGGITPETIVAAARAGADTFVAGSSVFKGQGDYAYNIKALKDAVAGKFS